jgi:hypothetical protein
MPCGLSQKASSKVVAPKPTMAKPLWVMMNKPRATSRSSVRRVVHQVHANFMK